jgi:hypothetical protein
MSRANAWTRGPLEWTGFSHEQPVSDAGRRAEQLATFELAKQGWELAQLAAGADIVVRDPKTQRDVSIEVKTVPASGDKPPLLVGDPDTDVDAQVFVAPEQQQFWIVPSVTVREKGRAGVLQGSDVEGYLGNWGILKTLLSS